MGPASVTGEGSALELSDIQGLVARGYGNLRSAGFLLAGVEDPDTARAWVGSLADAVTPSSARPSDHSLHVAFTPTGLAKLGLTTSGPGGFSPEFLGGMTTPHRRRILGDLGGSAPETWAWGGPTTPGVDVLLMMYARDAQEMHALRADQSSRLQGGGLREIERLRTRDLDGREHFGFHDGISQPIIEGLSKTGPWSNTVRAGEFVLGYPNEYDLETSGPLVDTPSDRAGVLARHPTGYSDFGRNGTYLVLRQLRQYVHRFWRYAHQASEQTDRTDAVALAAKLVGRWPSGAPLVSSPDGDDERLKDENDFSFHGPDPYGTRCPVGAHIRRANPRDSLDPDPGSRESFAINKRHRLLRRGRSYGKRVDIASALSGDDGSEDERGLHFICVNTNLARQFEFVQHTWLNNPTFGGLYEDPDPIVGATTGARIFTIQHDPVRGRLLALPEFVSVRGGAYFFLPSIRALRYLAELRV
jgi:Dyp-type peroxidase family